MDSDRPGPPVHPFTVTAGDGVRLHGEELGRGPALVLLHGGGPDRVSLRPLARRLAVRHRVLLPDIRGYGRSVCPDPEAHTWRRYVEDVRDLLGAHGERSAAVVGAGLGGTIALRCATDVPAVVDALVVISPEDIEDDEAKAAETALMDRFARTIRTDGLAAAWDLFLPHLQPLIRDMVTEALPRTDPASAAAAAAIGRDRALRSVEELAAVDCPTLVIAGDDVRHPDAMARTIVATVPNARLAERTFGAGLHDVDDLGAALAPEILAATASPGQHR